MVQNGMDNHDETTLQGNMKKRERRNATPVGLAVYHVWQVSHACFVNFACLRLSSGLSFLNILHIFRV